jgi:hypothetical protein
MDISAALATRLPLAVSVIKSKSRRLLRTLIIKLTDELVRVYVTQRVKPKQNLEPFFSKKRWKMGWLHRRR